MLMVLNSLALLVGCGSENFTSYPDNGDASAPSGESCGGDLAYIYGGDTPETMETFWYCKKDYQRSEDFVAEDLPTPDSELMIFRNGQGLLYELNSGDYHGRFDSHTIAQDSCSITLNSLDGTKEYVRNIHFFAIEAMRYVEFSDSKVPYVCYEKDGSKYHVTWNE